MGRGRLYGWLLRLYPRAFRERFGAAMESDFRGMRAAAHGPRGRARAWGVALLDLARSVPREWARSGLPRDGGLGRWMVDVGNAARTVRRRPGHALAVVCTLAVGVGATTALYSVLDAVVLSPLPYPEPDRLVRVWEATPQGQSFSTAEANFLDFRARNRTLSELAAFSYSQRTLLADGEPERLSTLLATPEATEVLGVAPLLGRAFTAAEGTPSGRANVVLLSAGLWERRFGADPAVLGRTLTLDGTPHEVVGVLPPGVLVTGDTDLWLPMVPDAGADRSDHEIELVGRLRDGVSLEAARADLARVARELGEEHPGTNAGWGVLLETFPEWIIGPALATTMLVLFLAGGLLLLVACTNASNLLLVRATERAREIGVRAALGAGRARIARQLVLESLLLSLCAGVLGTVLAYVGVPLLIGLAPGGIPRLETTAVDGAVLAFALVVALTVGIGFGMVPALHAVRRDVFASLRSGARVETRGGLRARRVMLVAQLALATMVLIGAALLRSSFVRLQAVDLGFDADRVLAVPLALTGATYRGCAPGGGPCDTETGLEARAAFLRTATDRLAGLPGVAAVGVTNISPLSGSGTVVDITVEGDAPRTQAEARFTEWRAVTGDPFEALGVPVLAGRTFTDGELGSGAAVVVVSRAFVDRYMQGREAVGHRIAFGTNGTNWRRIVGVVDDIRDRTVNQDVRPMLYFPHAYYPIPFVTLLVRTEVEAPASLAPSIRAELQAADATLPVPIVRPLSEYRAESVASERFAMTLMSVFAALALLLAVLGVYGTTLYDVTRRMREFGLRAALGARRPALLGQVLRETLRPLMIGLVAGILGAIAASDLLAATVFETEALRPPAFAAAAGVLAFATLCAGLLPALRATRVDPAVALGTD